MIIGLGTDICNIDRIKGAYNRLGERFLRRIYTVSEVDYCFGKRDPFPHLAGIYAAKEATKKALGTTIQYISLNDIEVIHTPSGCPGLRILGRSGEIVEQIGIKKLNISISHDRPSAIASVILE